MLQEIKLNWVSSPGPQPKTDTSSKYLPLNNILFTIHEYILS